MNILELRTEKERTLFTISLVVSIVFWAALVLGTLGIGLFYIAAGAAAVLVTQALFLAALKNTGVKITKEQLPELHARIENAANRLQLKEVPEAYLLNERGLVNAFATRFLGRDFVVLYAELLEACDESDGSIDFIIGHELGHLALNHVKFAPLLLPARAVPLLGAAYSRACEYSSDRAGTVAAQAAEGAVKGLAVLAAGRRYSKRIDILQYLEQRKASAGFWASVVELGMSHPYLPKRMGAILADTRPEVHVPRVERNFAAYFVAPFMGASGAGVAVMAVVMVIGMGAAIAIPNALKARNHDSAEAMMREIEEESKMRALEMKAEEKEDKSDNEAAEKIARDIEQKLRAMELEAQMKKAVDTEVEAAAAAAMAAEQQAFKSSTVKATKKAKKTKKVKTPKARKVAPAVTSEDEIY